MTTKTLLDGAAASFSADLNLTLGRQSAATTRSFNLSTEDNAALVALSSALPLPTGASTAANQTALNALFPATLGQKTMVASLAVVIASDQSAVPSSQFGTWNIGNISGTISLPTGAATSANQSTVIASVGAVGDAAWASGNGSAIAILKTIAGGVLDNNTPSPVKDANTGEWETVAASQTDDVIGATGAAGDYFSHIIIVPATTSPGAVSIKDGAGSAITIFAGGASSVTSLVPFTVALDMKSVAGAWKVTTGTNVSAIAVGNFT